MVRSSVNHMNLGCWTVRGLTENISRNKCFAMIVLATIATGGIANAHTADEAQAFAERAVAHIHDVGREQAFADFSRPDGGFVDGDLYIFCSDVSDDVVLAHGGNPKLVGHKMPVVRGSDGRLLSVQVHQLGLAPEGGWLEIRWPNPATKRIELKAIYVLKVDDNTVCGSGYYKGDSP
jgi:cytochrome c